MAPGADLLVPGRANFSPFIPSLSLGARRSRHPGCHGKEHAVVFVYASFALPVASLGSPPRKLGSPVRTLLPGVHPRSARAPPPSGPHPLFARVSQVLVLVLLVSMGASRNC